MQKDCLQTTPSAQLVRRDSTILGPPVIWCRAVEREDKATALGLFRHGVPISGRSEPYSSMAPWLSEFFHRTSSVAIAVSGRRHSKISGMHSCCRHRPATGGGLVPSCTSMNALDS